MSQKQHQVLTQWAHKYKDSKKAHFLLWLKNIPPYEMNILFIHLLDDRHWGYLHFLAILNNSTTNIYVYIFVCMYVNMFSILLVMPYSLSLFYPASIPLSGSWDNAMFNLWRNCQTFPKGLHHFAFPPLMYEGSKFYTFVTMYSFFFFF